MLVAKVWQVRTSKWNLLPPKSCWVTWIWIQDRGNRNSGKFWKMMKHVDVPLDAKKCWSMLIRCEWKVEPIPIGSMYGIYGNIYHQYTPNDPNVSIYTIQGNIYHQYYTPNVSIYIYIIHGSYGIDNCVQLLLVVPQPIPRVAGKRRVAWHHGLMRSVGWPVESTKPPLACAQPAMPQADSTAWCMSETLLWASRVPKCSR